MHRAQISRISQVLIVRTEFKVCLVKCSAKTQLSADLIRASRWVLLFYLILLCKASLCQNLDFRSPRFQFQLTCYVFLNNMFYHTANLGPSSILAKKNFAYCTESGRNRTLPRRNSLFLHPSRLNCPSFLFCYSP